jgi:hypothetical protein
MMHKEWGWISRYVLVIVVALVLGGIIGELPLFRQTTLGTPKLNASALVQFLGYGGALLLLWLLGRKASEQFRGSAGTSFLSYIILPLVTLIVVGAAYSVLLTILRPFLDAGPRNIYNWIFVLGITASALWLAIASFQHSEPLADLFKSDRPGTVPGAAKQNCKACGAELVAGANFCQICGAARDEKERGR